MIKEIEKKIKKLKNFFQNFSHKDTLIVSISGGADSSFLLIQAKKFQKDFLFNLQALYFSHNLQEKKELEKEKKVCSELCKKENVNLVEINLKIKKTKAQSLEELAREQRHYHYKKISEKSPKKFILLAHHQDDLIENFFIRFMRGSNSTGLTGLRNKFSPLNSFSCYRPLLEFSKKEILHYLKENNYKFHKDKSNEENKFLRNKIRNNLIPLIQKDFSSKSNEKIFELFTRRCEFYRTTSFKYCQKIYSIAH